MRELKFRALNADGEWCYGLPYYDQDGDLDMSLKSGFSDYGEIEKTIGQFTGLKDKNGIEIYEGDIINADFEGEYCPAFITFEDGAFRLAYPEWDVTLRKPYINALEIDVMDYIVIGNIHQTPELFN